MNFCTTVVRLAQHSAPSSNSSVTQNLYISPTQSCSKSVIMSNGLIGSEDIMTATCRTRLPTEVALGHGNISCLGSTTANYPTTTKLRSFLFCPRII